MLQCQICQKYEYHLSCYQLTFFVEEAQIKEGFCSKRCYNNRSKPAEKKRSLWSGDVPMPNVSSESVLLNWLTTPGSNGKWKGGSSQVGATKKRLTTEILLAIQEQELNMIELLTMSLTRLVTMKKATKSI